MSNKKWRNPANADAKTVDTSIPKQEARLKPSSEAVARAQELLAPPEPGTDRYALALLARAAEFLDEFIQQTRTALKRVAPEKLEAILNQVEPEPVESQPQKRPRGATHPILLMCKLGVTAARLLTQVVKATNPSLFTMSPDKADLLGLARQSGDFTARIERKKAEAILAAAGA